MRHHSDKISVNGQFWFVLWELRTIIVPQSNEETSLMEKTVNAGICKLYCKERTLVCKHHFATISCISSYSSVYIYIFIHQPCFQCKCTGKRPNIYQSDVSNI